MAASHTEHDPLLSLGEAAQRLGVHPATVRRWADRGDIEVHLTAGGHRRFRLSAVQGMLEKQGTDQNAPGAPAADRDELATRAISVTRSEIPRHVDERWMLGMSEKEREEKRMLGRRLVGLMMQYLSTEDGDGEEVLSEARAIGRLYARTALQGGMELADALKATMFFRDHLVESAILIPEASRDRPDVSKRVYRRINEFLNAVQLAVAGVYDDARGSGS